MTNIDPIAAPSAIVQHCPATIPLYTTGAFDQANGGMMQAGDGAYIRFSFTLPVGARVKAIRIGLRKLSCPKMPSAMPTVTVTAFDYTDTDNGRGKGEVVGSPVRDPSANLVTYSSYHLVGPVDLDHVVQPGCVYLMVVKGDVSSVFRSGHLLVSQPIVDLVMPSAQAA